MIKNFWKYPRVKAVFFGVLAVVLGLALASYSPTDKAWNTASGENYHNWLGPIGSWSADLLLQLMGQVAFLVPLAFLTFAVFLWVHLKWVKTRGFVLVVAFLMAMWLATTIPVRPAYTGWFKSGAGGFLGYYLHEWIPVPQGGWLILLWALCSTLFIFAFKIPALKMTALTGKGALWGLKKLPVRMPEKIKKPFAALHVHNQIQKIKKAAPKAKIKAVKSAPVKEVAENKEGRDDYWTGADDIVAKLNHPDIHGLPPVTGEAAKRLVEKIKAGKYPLTREGVVAQLPGKQPVKSKVINDYDVVIRNIFKADTDRGDMAGGFEYSYPDSDERAGRVGTGFNDKLRKDMWQHPENYIGMLARVHSQERLSSGALRAPGLVALRAD